MPLVSLLTVAEWIDSMNQKLHDSVTIAVRSQVVSIFLQSTHLVVVHRSKCHLGLCFQNAKPMQTFSFINVVFVFSFCCLLTRESVILHSVASL